MKLTLKTKRKQNTSTNRYELHGPSKHMFFYLIQYILNDKLQNFLYETTYFHQISKQTY